MQRASRVGGKEERDRAERLGGCWPKGLPPKGPPPCHSRNSRAAASTAPFVVISRTEEERREELQGRRAPHSRWQDPEPLNHRLLSPPSNPGEPRASGSVQRLSRRGSMEVRAPPPPPPSRSWAGKPSPRESHLFISLHPPCLWPPELEYCWEIVRPALRAPKGDGSTEPVTGEHHLP